MSIENGQALMTASEAFRRPNGVSIEEGEEQERLGIAEAISERRG